MNNINKVATESEAEVQSGSERWLKRVARVLFPAIVAATTIQPMAYAAPTPSLLMQEPRFLDVRVEPNVVFMMDDSDSMNDTRLPVPSDRNPQAGAQVTIRGWYTGLDQARAPQVDTSNTNQRLVRARDNDWIHRSSALNPLYYNPAIEYRPWNDNNRLNYQNTTNTFGAASIDTTVPGEGFLAGLIRQDMRYKGANYFYGNANDRSAFSTVTGANPPALSPSYSAPQRPANQGFQGATYPANATPTHNQDIFSSPLVRVTGITNQCVPTSSVFDRLQFDRRTIQVDRQTGNRNTYPILDENRPSLSQIEERTRQTVSMDPIPNSRSYTTLADPISRPSYPIDTVGRNVAYDITTNDRPYSGTVQFSTRPSDPINSDLRQMLYRVRQGPVCGQGAWSGYIYTSAPQVPCDNGTEQGGFQDIDWTWSTCPNGTEPGTGANVNRCYTTCAAPNESIGGRCYSSCNTQQGLEVDPSNRTQCRTQCAGTVIFTSNENRCYQACPNGFAATGTPAIQCRRTCPTGNIINDNGVDRCYTTCPQNYEFTTGAASTSKTCTRTCSSPDQAINGRCYTACTNPSFPTASGQQCLAACAGDRVGNLCYTGCIPQGTVVNPNDVTTCRPACPGNIINGVCYTNCPTPTQGFPALNYVDQVNSPLCRSQCTGTAIGTTCYGSCGNDANGRATAVISGTPTMCRTTCSGTNRFVSGNTCLADCANQGYQPLADNSMTCVGSCPQNYPNVSPSDASKCLPNCGQQGAPAGDVSGAFCVYCPQGSTAFGSPQRCCPTANYNSNPIGICPFTDQSLCQPPFPNWRANPDLPALAYYFAYMPAPAPQGPVTGGLDSAGNYVLVEINRRDRNTMLFPRAATRTDCATYRPSGQDPGACTWDEEARNFANWYTYYRTRLFSAIATSAEALSNLRAGRDQIRLGYGSINYFPGGRNVYGALTDRLPDPMTLDGQSSVGHLVRGVRPFTEVVPPPAPGSDSRRQEVFDWLFSLRAIGATPNREAMDAIGRYFSRSDAQGPWITPNGRLPNQQGVVAGRWSSDEASNTHVSCRRNYAIMITDGEWTNQVNTALQPRVEDRGTTLNALSTSAPAVTQLGQQTPTFVPYTPQSMPQFGDGASSQGGSLTDIAMLYWSRDLRSDLQNNVPIVEPSQTNRQGDPAFWQHMQPFLIGYGISASMDTTPVKDYIVARSTNVSPVPAAPQTWPWPTVNMASNVITDRDTSPTNCNYSASTNPSGCGRVNDTMRAALAGRGDFLSAADISVLAQGIANAFSAIAEVQASSTSVGGRSATIQAGDRVFLANFRTQRWTGRIDSFDAKAYMTSVANNSQEPQNAPDRVTSSFPAWNARSIFTSTARQTAIAFPATDFGSLTSAQQTALGSVDVLQWLRGNHQGEARNGGINGVVFRNRGDGEFLADIINSTPLFSPGRRDSTLTETTNREGDFGYSAARKPDGIPSTTAANAYRDFVRDNRAYRKSIIMVGANGGMFHAFDASGSPVQTLPPNNTPNADYNADHMKELFAYVPRAMYPQLADLSSPNYIHRYFVDGQVVEGDIYINNAWRRVAVGTSGAGPKSIFALDVTLRNGSQYRAFRDQDVMWDIDVAADNPGGNDRLQHVGHIMGPGVIASVKGELNKWFYLVGNGYESASDEARLLAIDMSTGQIAAAIKTDGAGGSNPAANNRTNRPNGLGGITPVYDAARNVIGVYAGDRLGRLWKFDLRNGLSSAESQGGQLLFDTIDNPVVNRDSQPITAAPRFMPHPLGGRIVIFGTGRFSELADTDDRSVQSVYAVWERNPSASAVEQVTWNANPPNNPRSIYGSSGPGLTLSDVRDANDRRFRVLSNTTGLDWTQHSGWYFNLRVGTSNTGERVLVTPVENFGFMNVTSYEPVAGGDACRGGGASFFYRLDVAGSFSRSPFSQLPTFPNLQQQPDPKLVVGSEMPALIGAPTLLTAGSTPSSVTGSALDSTTLSNMQRSRATATDPCATIRAFGRSTLNQPVLGLPLTCSIPPLRVWRELPRVR